MDAGDVEVEPVGSNVVIVPSVFRKKPCDTLLGVASRYTPVIWPAGFIDTGNVASELGTSNVVMVPSAFRKKPWPSFVKVGSK
jgi:hypothetical protein